MITKIIFNPESFGITGKSLKELRNSICQAYNDEIAIFQIDTADIICGFMLIDKKNGTAYWSGDGFRTDNGGEGGRGYRAADKLITETFRLPLNFHYEKMDMSVPSEMTDDKEKWYSKKLLEYANKIIADWQENVSTFTFTRISEKYPSY